MKDFPHLDQRTVAAGATCKHGFVIRDNVCPECIAMCDQARERVRLRRAGILPPFEPRKKSG